MPLPAGGTAWLRMDLTDHVVVVESSEGLREALPMDTGMTGTEFGAALAEMVAGFGLEGDYETGKFESDEPRRYVPGHAAGFFAALVNINHNLEVHRSSLEGQVGPLQVWPHGFDLAFEWFGSETEQTEGSQAQLNLGFYPAGRAYFYSNPWPFDPALTATELPGPAEWRTEGWEGTILHRHAGLDDPP